MCTEKLHANSRKLIKSWKSPLSNAENPGSAKNSSQPKEQNKAQLRETGRPAAESRAKLDVSAWESEPIFQCSHLLSTSV